jgi:hypothetical protein
MDKTASGLPRRAGRRRPGIGLWAWAALLAGASAQAQPLPPQGAPPGPQAMMSAPPPSGPPNVLSEAARTLGVQQCGPDIDAIAPRVFAGSERQDIVLDWDRRTVDRAPFFSLTGLQYRDGAALFTLTTIPQPAGGCTVLAEHVSASAMSCTEVARRQLPGYQGTPLVRAVTVYTSAAHAHETVTLVQAPPGCLMLRRQVRYAGH